jgi:ectoine hydroxylase-related dioxygenase (phytanoyl-CoA dioxygenase family)
MLPPEGYVLKREVLSAAEVEALRRLMPSRQTRALLDDPRTWGVIKEVRTRLLDERWRVVRGLLFDKTARQNWALGWHRDTSLALRARHDVPGFGPWTTKHGVTHAIAPRAILEQMISLRVHLDDVDDDNGPLRVKAGSHVREDGEERTCLAAAGDVLLFSPLLVHASSSAMRPGHRRVVQLECAHTELPPPLSWRWWV